jgi:hypothetical protein
MQSGRPLEPPHLNLSTAFLFRKDKSISNMNKLTLRLKIQQKYLYKIEPLQYRFSLIIPKTSATARGWSRKIRHWHI